MIKNKINKLIYLKVKVRIKNQRILIYLVIKQKKWIFSLKTLKINKKRIFLEHRIIL